MYLYLDSYTQPAQRPTYKLQPLTPSHYITLHFPTLAPSCFPASPAFVAFCLVCRVAFCVRVSFCILPVLSLLPCCLPALAFFPLLCRFPVRFLFGLLLLCFLPPCFPLSRTHTYYTYVTPTCWCSVYIPHALTVGWAARTGDSSNRYRTVKGRREWESVM